MFVMDVPPDVPPQYAPIVIAQVSPTKQSSAAVDRTVGVCQMIGNPAIPPETAQNAVGPLGDIRNYIRIHENRIVEAAGNVSVLKGPSHGTLEDIGQGKDFRYHPAEGYLGQDHATFLVEMAGLKIKLVYFLQVVPGPPDNEVEDEVCPRYTWKISLNPDDPNAPIYTFDHPSQLTSTLAGVVQANLTFTDLAGSGRRLG